MAERPGFLVIRLMYLSRVKQILTGSEAQPEECYFAIFTFASSSGIDDALLALRTTG
jgi:hypothetical protein